MKLLLTLLLIIPISNAQPAQPVEEWTGKTILLIGGHPDDDHQSHATLALLKDHGNEIYFSFSVNIHSVRKLDYGALLCS